MEPAKDMALEYLHSQLRKRDLSSDSEGAFTPPMPVPQSPPPRQRGSNVSAMRSRQNNGFSFNEFRSQSAEPKKPGLRRPDLSALVGALDAELRKERKFPSAGAMPPRLGFGSLPGSARLPPGSMPMGATYPGGPGSARLPPGAAAPGQGSARLPIGGPGPNAMGSARLPIGGSSGTAAASGVPALSLPAHSGAQALSSPRPQRGVTPRGQGPPASSLIPSYSMLEQAGQGRSPSSGVRDDRGRSPSPSYLPPPTTANPMAFVWKQPQLNSPFNSPRNSPGPPEALRGRLPDNGPLRAFSGSSIDLEGIQARTQSMLASALDSRQTVGAITGKREATTGSTGVQRAQSPATQMRPMSPGPFRSSRASSPATRRDQAGARQRSGSPALPMRVRASAPMPGGLPTTSLASAIPRWSEAPPTVTFQRHSSPLSPRPGSPLHSPRATLATAPAAFTTTTGAAPVTTTTTTIAPAVTTTIVNSGTAPAVTETLNAVNAPVPSETGTVWSWKMTTASPDGGLGASMAAALGASTAPAPFWNTGSTVSMAAPYMQGSISAPLTMTSAPTATAQGMSAGTLAMTAPATAMTVSSQRDHSASIAAPATAPASSTLSAVPVPTAVATPSSAPTALPTPYASTNTIATQATATTIAAALPQAVPSSPVVSLQGTTSTLQGSVQVQGSSPTQVQPPASPVRPAGGMPGPPRTPPRASSGQTAPVASAASASPAAPSYSVMTPGTDRAPYSAVVAPSAAARTPSKTTAAAATPPAVVSAAPASTPPTTTPPVSEATQVPS